ncbi:MAG: nuclear transport factor 2 family protein [Pseudomonadota bacterium]
MDHARSLEGLLDKADIADLIHAYCAHFDRGEAEAVVALFTDDAVIDYGPEVPPMTGKATFGPMIAKGLAELFAATSHHASNIVVTFDGPDTARSSCYVYAWHRYAGSDEESELWGQYHHDMRRTAEGWRIARLVLKAAGMRNFHRATMHPIGRRTPV